MKIQHLTTSSENYPGQLAEIHQPPQDLYVLGKIPAAPMLTIVGTRRPSSYGEEVTYRLSYECAQAGMTIVSGLALGLDTIAHQSALDAGGSTIAVLGCGLDRIYPSANRSLAMNILKNRGAIVSEYPVGTEPFKSNFVARNRIVAGLSDAVIVTEAQAKSGTLITANYGLQQNRLVMAVPGNITSWLSAGPNNLLRAGATPITSSADVLTALGYEAVLHSATSKPNSKEEAKVLELLENGHVTIEAMLRKTPLTPPQLASTLSLMEITGQIRNLGAGQWTKA